MGDISGMRRIIHLSDLHCGSPYFMPDLLEMAISEVNSMTPDAVVVSGDLTAEGFVDDYRTAASYLETIECQHQVVIPGNHDSRNVGYVHFEDMIGVRNPVLHMGDISIVCVDSTEPDLNNGRVGRGRYDWIHEQFRYPANLRIFVLHHHLIPIPGTGRERSVVHDAGDLLEVLLEAHVDLVLGGHKHVPHAWQLEGLFVVNAGTVSTTRLRGRGRPSYNIIDVTPDLKVSIDQKFPGGDRVPMLRFDAAAHRQEGTWKKFPITR